MQYALSPRFAASGGTNDGGYAKFTPDASGRITQIDHFGLVNFAPSDATNTILQPTAPRPPAGSNGIQLYKTDTVAYYLAGGPFTNLIDSDGHSTNWYPDSLGRVTQRNLWTGSQPLYDYQVWDSQNNLIQAIDVRGNVTDEAYDDNGNVIALAAPPISLSNGYYRPTSLYSYDANSNLTAYCDPNTVYTLGYDWAHRPKSDQLCTSGTGMHPALYAWDTADQNEPYGRLASATTPLGYNTRYTYDGYGELLSQVGTSDSQDDGSLLAPAQSFVYDQFGNVIASNSLSSSITQTSAGNSRFGYDKLNRQNEAVDPDGVTSCTWYNADGSVSASESAAEHALVSAASPCSAVPTLTPNALPLSSGQFATTYSYNVDGDEVGETHHYNCVQGPSCTSGLTQKWYDGADRLVEVQLPLRANTSPPTKPPDPQSDVYDSPWRTRYLYGLSQTGNVSIDKVNCAQTSCAAHGNLFATQEYFNTSIPWRMTHAQAHDSLDRVTTDYHYSQCIPSGGLGYYATVGALLCPDNIAEASTSVYDVLNSDGSGGAGLLASTQDGLHLVSGVKVSSEYNYDAAGRLWLRTFNDGATPNQQFIYDPNGNATTVWSGQFGSFTFAYDADGRLISRNEPSGNGISSPAQLTYSYYKNGLRRALSVSSSALTSNFLTYSYRSDGLLTTLKPDAALLPTSATNKTFTRTYSPAGRVLLQSDPFTGATISDLTGCSITGGKTCSPYPASYATFQPKAYSYANGQIQTLTLPSHQMYRGFAYDAEGELTSATGFDVAGSSTFKPVTLTNSYSLRGELYQHNYSGGGQIAHTLEPNPTADVWPSFSQRSANGFMLQLGRGATPQVNSQQSWDPLNKVMLSMTPPAFQLDPFKYHEDWSYDYAGRASSSFGPGPGPGVIREYNMLDQQVSWRASSDGRSCSNAITSRNYAYGPDGNLAQITDPSYTITYPNGSTFTVPSVTRTVHWDGGTPLFTSNQDGTLSGAMIGRSADLLPSASMLAIHDRDYAGYEVSHHGKFNGVVGFSSWVPPDPYGGGLCNLTRVYAPPSSAGYSVGFPYPPVIAEPMPVGVSDGVNQFQGVRSYDSQPGTWTSRDQSSGSLGDPMSQTGYAYSAGNPLSNVDPSGFEPQNNDPSGPSLGEACDGYYQTCQNIGTVRVVAGPSGDGFDQFMDSMTPLMLGANMEARGIYDSLKMARVAQLGREGEAAAGLVKNTEQIESRTPGVKYRIPDSLNRVKKFIAEVKNVSSLSYTSQLKDFAAFATLMGYRFDLYVRADTKLSGPLEDEINAGRINKIFLP